MNKPPDSTHSKNNSNWNKAFLSLQIPDYRWYFIGVNFSFFAMQMLMIARGWLVYEMTGSPLQLGIVSAIAGIPMLIVTPIGGVVADRVNKRKLIIITEIVACLCSVVLAILIITNTIQTWHITVNALIAGIAAAFNMPTRQSIIAELVGEDHLMSAITMNSIGLNSGRIIGPAAAGLLAGLIGVGGVYIFTAFLYVLVILSMSKISKRETTQSHIATSPLKDLIEGWVYTYRHQIILGQIVIACAICIFGLPYMTLMPVFAKDIFQGGVTDLGILTSASSIGFLIGSLGLAFAGELKRTGLILLGSVLMFGIAMILFSLSSNFYLSCLILVFIGIANSICLVLNQIIIQTTVEPGMRGRILALTMMTWGLQSLGAFPIGALAEVMGAPWTIGVSGLLLFLSSVAITILMPRLKNT